jgi:hypothetical protein
MHAKHSVARRACSSVSGDSTCPHLSHDHCGGPPDANALPVLRKKTQLPPVGRGCACKACGLCPCLGPCPCPCPCLATAPVPRKMNDLPPVRHGGVLERKGLAIHVVLPASSTCPACPCPVISSHTPDDCPCLDGSCHCPHQVCPSMHATACRKAAAGHGGRLDVHSSCARCGLVGVVPGALPATQRMTA